MKNSRSFVSAGRIDPSWRIGIVFSSYYEEEVSHLVAGAKSHLMDAGIPLAHISEHAVHGSFEIPLIGSVLADGKQADALIGLGIIVEGETHHARLVAEETARGIMDVQVQAGMPFAFEVLYVDSLDQARERPEKGAAAAASVLHSLAEISRIRSGRIE